MPFPIPIPSVVETTARGRESWDLFSRLLKDRIMFIGWPVDDFASTAAIAQMLFLQVENKEQDINLYLNSPGGWSMAVLAIYDTMQFIANDVQTYCIGECSRDAALLLAAGAKGKRYALPHSRIMLHQPQASVQGQASRIQRNAEVLRLKDKLTRLIAHHSGTSYEQVEKDCDRDNFMDPQQAKEYGLIDEIYGDGPAF